MPSRLVNLRRQLTWSDFGTPRPGPDPQPGVHATAAQTRATYRQVINAEYIEGTNPHEFRLKDDVVITVILQTHSVFVNAWVFRRPTSFQDDVLHHEQGHYDFVALFCRDMFIDIMALKQQTFPRPQDVLTAVQQIFRQYDPLIAGVHDPYDVATEHGLLPAQQQRWDGFISTAFTQVRNPPVSAPDGTPYKTPLLDVLNAGGVHL